MPFHFFACTLWHRADICSKCRILLSFCCAAVTTVNKIKFLQTSLAMGLQAVLYKHNCRTPEVLITFQFFSQCYGFLSAISHPGPVFIHHFPLQLTTFIPEDTRLKHSFAGFLVMQKGTSEVFLLYVLLVLVLLSHRRFLINK